MRTRPVSYTHLDVYKRQAQCCDEAILRGEERPTARRIEKLGLEWARLGVRSQADAVVAIRRMARREQTVAEVRRRLRLSPDARIPSDDAYIARCV